MVTSSALRRPHLLAGVISDARGRRRRRLCAIAAVTACAGIGAGLLLAGTGSPPAVGRAERVAPGAVLAQAPRAGVACYRHSCDWLGLAVWLRQPAVAVSATIGGHPLALERTHAYPATGARAVFAGFLRPYRLVTHVGLVAGPVAMWDVNSSQWPAATVRLRIVSPDGRILRTRVVVVLQPGWG